MITLHEHLELPPVFGDSLLLVFLIFSGALCVGVAYNTPRHEQDSN